MSRGESDQVLRVVK